MKKQIGLVAVAVTILVGFHAPAYASWMNGLTMNGLTMNGITQNGITGNGLTMNALVPNGTQGNGEGTQGLSNNGVVEELLNPTAIVIELPIHITAGR